MCKVADFTTNFGIQPATAVQNNLSSSMICILIPISTLLLQIQRKKPNYNKELLKIIHVLFCYLTVI